MRRASLSPFLLITRGLWLGVALGLLYYLGLTLWLALSGIFFPYQLDYGEGIVLWFTHLLAHGEPIYKGLEGLPYATNNYPPLANVLALPFYRIFGDSYIGGRWLNFAAALITATLIYKIVRTETKPNVRNSHLSAAASALFFLGSVYVYHWIPLFRVDLIGLAFTVSGVFFVWQWERASMRIAPSRTVITTYLGLAAFFFLCGLYTKHSLFFAPAAAVIALFLRDKRLAAYFGLVLLTVGGAIFIALDLWTRGGFAFSLIEANATLWLWSTFQPLITNFLIAFAVLLPLAAWGWLQRVRVRQPGVLEIYGIGGIASLALAGRIGAYDNYFFEAIFVICIFAAFAVAPWLARGLSSRWWLELVLLLQLLLFSREHDPVVARTLFEWTRSGNEDVAPLVRAAQGTVISEDMGLLVTNDQPVTYYTFQYSSLARASKWDQHWELENLRAGKFPLVILYQGTRENVDQFGNFTRDFVSALDHNYALSREDIRYHVYTPAPLAHLRAENFGGAIQLVGWTLTPATDFRAGETLSLSVVWRAQRKMDARYTAFAHLEDKNAVVAQDDHEPRVGVVPFPRTYPTSDWGTGENVRDTYSLQLREGLAAGQYALRVGWYDSVTQDHLGLEDGADLVELAKLEIK